MNEPRAMPGFPVEADEYREDEDVPDSGALLRWEKGDGGSVGHVALLGIRTVIFCLIICSGRMIQDGEFVLPVVPTVLLSMRSYPAAI